MRTDGMYKYQMRVDLKSFPCIFLNNVGNRKERTAIYVNANATGG